MKVEMENWEILGVGIIILASSFIVFYILNEQKKQIQRAKIKEIFESTTDYIVDVESENFVRTIPKGRMTIPKDCITIVFVKKERDVGIERDGGIERAKYKVYIIKGTIKELSEINS